MKKTLEIYALIVCFFTLVWFSSALIFLADEVIRIAYPEITVSVPDSTTPSSEVKQVSAEKTAKEGQLSQKKYEDALQKEKKDGIKNALHQFMTLLVTGIIFGFHWKLFRSERLAS
jgi:hypothetical protein